MAHNNYFRFKQFLVEQNHAAMRVGTDGVLLGAWTNCSSAQKILDIGTGTGIVSLMLAQRTSDSTTIVGIDIDQGAISDAVENFRKSPWNNRLQAIYSSIQTFSNAGLFDLIVCNPPFFSNSLKATDPSRNLARHTDALPYCDLFENVAKILSPNGLFAVVIPADIEPTFRNLAANYKLFTHRLLRVRPNPSKPVKRILVEYAFNAELKEESEIIIETERHHEYTYDFKSLITDFYL